MQRWVYQTQNDVRGEGWVLEDEPDPAVLDAQIDKLCREDEEPDGQAEESD
jgi:hypothetical protein